MQQPEKGKFIVFEGGDRCGKTTQSNLLTQYLIKSGKKTVLIGFPNRETEIGKLINKHLKGEVNFSPDVAHLLFAANRREMQKNLIKYLSSGINVVCDRYYYSGMAYSYANGIDISWCLDVDDGIIDPDLVIQIETSAEVASSRPGYGLEKGENIAFQKKVAEGFQYFQRRDYWVVVDGNEEKTKISTLIKKMVASRLFGDSG